MMKGDVEMGGDYFRNKEGPVIRPGGKMIL